MRAPLKIESIGVCLKPDQPDCEEVLGRIVVWAKKRQIKVVLDQPVAGSSDLPVIEPEQLYSQVDLIIAVGGDGTLLGAARSIGSRDVPILGINLGRLGFLTEVNRDELEDCLDRIARGELTIEARMRLDVSVFREDDEVAKYLALNDVVITRSAISRLVDLETFANGAKVTTYHGDGLIISTPTGSTAYSLSASGPILMPNVEAIVLNPICAHSLNQCPIVLPHHSEIEVRPVFSHAIDTATLTVDGQEGFELGPGDRVVTKRSPHDAYIAASPFRNHFEILHTKLNWGDR